MKVTPTTKRILLIDDEPDIRLIVKACLETFNPWEVLLANSGVEGLLKAKQLKPHAIILDMMMPEMDGVSCLEKLQSNIETQSIPVIFLTANWTPSEADRFLGLGAVGAIAKPFDPLKLAPQIAQCLQWSLEDLGNLN